MKLMGAEFRLVNGLQVFANDWHACAAPFATAWWLWPFLLKHGSPCIYSSKPTSQPSLHVYRSALRTETTDSFLWD
jgi:hypothetical protein